MTKIYFICCGTYRCFISERRVFFISLLCSIIVYLLLSYKSIICSQLCPYKSVLTHNRLTFDHNHFVEHYAEFICSQNFRNLADWVYGWPGEVFDEKIEATTNEYFAFWCLPHGSIIYVKTDHLRKFFNDVYPHLINKFVLITAQGDGSSPGRFLSYLHHPDSKIIHWFGQNTDIQSAQSSKFTPIPIGINCYEMANGIRQIHQQKSNHTLPPLFADQDEPQQYSYLLDNTYQMLAGHHHRSLLLINFQRLTDPTGIRSHIWQLLCHNHSNSTFTACIDKPDGVQISLLSQIYTHNRQYPLWLSPRGNGLDCHRTWEALYLDVIPIVYNSTLYSLFLNLPIIIINDSSELTEQFLRTKLHEIAMNKVKSPAYYRIDELRFSYWRRLILSKSRHSITNTKRKNQCWRAKTVTKKSK